MTTNNGMQIGIIYRKLIVSIKVYGFRRLCAITLADIKRFVWLQIVKRSHSGTGEDLVIDQILGNKKEGFYIDVGAYDPNRLSNTKRFYLRGWKGINIEPDYNNYKKFTSSRKRDINLNIGIGEQKKNSIFFKFFPSTLSTFSPYSANQYIKEGFQLVETINIEVVTLKSIFTTYCINKIVDFITIDTEGSELEILQSNDWKKFRPRVICIEAILPSGKKTKRDTKIEKFLLSKGYKKYLEITINIIFYDKELKEFENV